MVKSQICIVYAASNKICKRPMYRARVQNAEVCIIVKIVNFVESSDIADSEIRY